MQASIPPTYIFDDYDKTIDIMIDALHTFERAGISRFGMLLGVVDFVVTVALVGEGEAGARAVVTQVDGRIDDWKAGLFPMANER